MCSIASIALGIYSFTLPRTPPLPKPEEQARLGHVWVLMHWSYCGTRTLWCSL